MWRTPKGFILNKEYRLLAFSIALISAATSCTDEAKYKAMETKYQAVQDEIAKHRSMHKLMADEEAQHSGHVSMHHDIAPETTSIHKINTAEISRNADDLPPPLNRAKSQLVSVNLYTEELVAEIMPEVSYQYWTYNGKVPGPFIRARAGDQVEIHLMHGKPGATHEGHSEHTAAQHAAAGHSAHSIDLHAVVGPGGGAPSMQVGQGEEKSFRFNATHPGIYVYHCASPHVPTHIANGMYGMILIEPPEGLAKVDREFYVMQGEFYTDGKYGDKGFQSLNKEKLLAEHPEYFLFNGRVNALTGDRALKAKVGEKIRLFVGIGSHIAANFHIIGAIFDKLYLEGAIMSPPLKNVQTTQIAPGSAVMVEFTIDVPGKYLLVDHSLTRAIDKGALAELIIDG
jgi:nitrite reductase (NO-forming)